MFSSLPSASKIYVSSNKPKQKNIPSAKRKRKKVACSSSADSHSEETLVSRTAERRNSSVNSHTSSNAEISFEKVSDHSDTVHDQLVESSIESDNVETQCLNVTYVKKCELLNNDSELHHNSDEPDHHSSELNVSQKEISDDISLPESQQTIINIEEQTKDSNYHSSETESDANETNPIINIVSDDIVYSPPTHSSSHDSCTQTVLNSEAANVHEVQAIVHNVGSSFLGDNLSSEMCDSASVKSDCCMATFIYQDHVVNSESSSLEENDNGQNDENNDQSPKQSETSHTESMCNVHCASETVLTNNSSSLIRIEKQTNQNHVKSKKFYEKVSYYSVDDLKKSDINEQLKHSMSLPENISINTNKVDHNLCNSCKLKSKILIDKETSTLDLKSKLMNQSTYTLDSECYLKYVHIPKKMTNFQSETKDQYSVTTFQDATEVILKTLPTVSTIKARSRSYVFGSIGAPGSLLGNEELKRFFPDSKVKVFVGTWNMNGQNPPNNIDDFLLPLNVSCVPDIYAIGVQESMQSRTEWEILLQTTLGPTHVLFASTTFGVLHLSIFLRRDLIWFCSEPEEANIATRPGSMIKTKGAVAICFLFFGTSFLFVNSHLTAHEQNLKERFSDYEKICSSLELPKFIPLKHQKSKDVTARFDCVFWCGDLNFRVVQDRPRVMSIVEKIRQPDSSENSLLEHDQLSQAMAKGITFHEFKEGVINFIPSYKFSIGTSCFDSTKLRVPSYTDRILYRSMDPSSIVCLNYDAVPEISTSDHKPVFGIFDVSVKPGRDNIPLAAGLFKRNVYLEAIKRRALQLEVTRNHKQSTICNIM